MLHCGERLTLDPLFDARHGQGRRAHPRRRGQGEKIAVFGDYDVDGITATCLMTDALRRAGRT